MFSPFLQGEYDVVASQPVVVSSDAAVKAQINAVHSPVISASASGEETPCELADAAASVADAGSAPASPKAKKGSQKL